MSLDMFYQLVRLVRIRKKNLLFNCLRCKDRNWLKQCECGKCDKITTERDIKCQPRKYLPGHHLIGERGKNYKNGRTKTKNYWYIHLPDYFGSNKEGYVLEHVYFYEQYNKCCMLPWGDVHHIIPVTENYCNNMIWNLQGMLHSNHIRFHHTKYMSDRKCFDCGSNKTWVSKKGHSNWSKYGFNWLCNKCNCKRKRLLKKLNR